MEGMKRASNVVSFLDWRTSVDYDCKEKKVEGERIGSGLSLLSACGGESDCVDLNRFRDNGRWGSQIYEKAENRSTPLVEVSDKEGSNSCNNSKEPMFEKAVTPSDVGKLNRLVIPKHHAEKYFPLDTTSNDKGLLLNFEDNTGKAWRFRYSYWNSSQSYVLTKGWSRFVKEKKLDAGDIVSFERSTDGNNADQRRLFISWKRRPCALQIQPGSNASLLRRLSLPASLAAAAAAAAAPTFQYGALPLSFPLQSQALFRAASCSPNDWMSVVWPPNNGGALWRLPEASPLPLGHHVRLLPAAEQNSGKEPHAHDFMQLKVTGDRSSPVESAREMSSSKKGVRLFGVNL